MLLSGWWTDRCLSKVSVKISGWASSFLKSWINQLVLIIKMLSQRNIHFGFMEVWSFRSCCNKCSFVFLKLCCKVFVQLFEIRNGCSHFRLEGWCEVLILLFEIFLLLNCFNLWFFHPRGQLRQFKTHFSISLYSLVSFIILVDDCLVQRYKYFPWNFISTEGSMLRNISWKFSFLFLSLSGFLISLVEIEGPLSSLNFGHSKLSIVLWPLSLFLLHLLKLVGLDTGGHCSSFVLYTQSSLLLFCLVFYHFLHFLLTDWKTFGLVHEFKWHWNCHVVLSFTSFRNKVLLLDQFLFKCLIQTILFSFKWFFRLGILITWHISLIFSVLLVKLKVDLLIFPQSSSFSEESKE